MYHAVSYTHLIKALEMIARYLETAVFEPTNAAARNGMAVAQYIAMRCV